MTDHSATPTASLLRRDLAILLLILLPYCLLLLGARPLSVPDEGRYPEIAREMLVSGNFITPTVNGLVFLDKPALYYWLEAASMHVFGVNPWAIRLPSALFAMLGATLVFMTAFRLFSRRAAWLATAALMTNPLYFLSGQYADMNLEIAILVTAALCLFLLGRQEATGSRERRMYFWLGWMAIGFGILTKGLIGLVFPAMVVGCWAVLGWRWRELPHWYFISGGLIAAAACVPWFRAVQAANPDFLHYFFIYQQFERYTSGGFNNPHPWWFYLVVLAGGLLPWSLWLPKALYNQLRAAWGSARLDQVDSRQMLLLWPLLILLFFSLPKSKIVGYILPVVPPLAMLLGDYLDRRLQQAGHQQAWTLKMLPGFAMIGALGCLTLLLLIPRYEPVASIRPLAQQLQQQMKTGGELVVFHTWLHDLPIYLNSQQPIKVVENWDDAALMQEDDWHHDFAFGLQHQPEARQWLLNDGQFAVLSKAAPRLFVLARARDEALLTGQYRLQVVGRIGKIILLQSAPANP